MKPGDLIRHTGHGQNVGIVIKISPVVGVPGGMAKISWVNECPPGTVKSRLLYRAENLEVINASR